MRFFHGTSRENANAIIKEGLAAGQYVSSDFELAASYALRNSNPIVLEVQGAICLPKEVAYDDIEFIATETLTVIGVFAPKFVQEQDWYELDENLDRLYPEYFDPKNWDSRFFCLPPIR